MDIFGNPVIVIGVGVVVLLILLVMLLRSLSSKQNIPVKVENPNIGKPMSKSESIGDISVRLGDDVRDVWGMGFSDDQINDVLTGKYTLTELYKMKPDGNHRTPKGQEILSKR